MTSRKIPEGLKAHSRSRSALVVERVEEAKRILRNQFVSGELTTLLAARKGKTVTEADVMRVAKLHPNTLNGPTHKHSTKHTVSKFLTQLNADIADQRIEKADEAHDKWKEMYNDLVRKHDRLLTRAHGWKLTMFMLARENRELKSKLGVKVVKLMP